MGLVRQWATPIRPASAESTPTEVSMTRRAVANEGSALIARTSVRPSISGIWWSTSTTRYGAR